MIAYVSSLQVERLRFLHELGFIHNDIKLENVLVGRDDPQDIHLIDYGLATQYRDKNGQHIVKKKLHSFRGNLLFASLNSCRGFNQSRRDDIESAFYLLVYLLNGQKLPWSTFPQKFANSSKFVLEFLQNRLQKRIFRQIP